VQEKKSGDSNDSRLDAKEPGFLTYEEAARHCSLHKVTLWRAVRAGALRPSGYGRAVRFAVEDLHAFMRSRGSSG
jgi:excisionase family DNA binding protein